uniref:Uncharacterized protein n=1 Tax=Rhodosorus marinus TaxID=101924 RepID=A0A7S2ZC98_9RHOD|mmetsp:Transcript_14339/g.58018  ORF Transcript_14339/g.58018 Transcript_14339/m.58018 type:complete len:241 (+) Transcript_14339:205-927(+)
MVELGFVWSSSAFLLGTRRQCSWTQRYGKSASSFNRRPSLRRSAVRMEVGPSDPGYISTLSKPIQAAVTLLIYAGIALATVALNILVAPKIRSIRVLRILSRALGLFFAAVGVQHFTLLQEISSMVPEKGAWGYWYLPGSAEFHTKWTGMAEVLGGLGVLLGDLPFLPLWVGPYAAAGLFLLVIVVTPSNMYMVTHGVLGPVKVWLGEDTVLRPNHHVIRMLLQAVLLSTLCSMAVGFHK